MTFPYARLSTRSRRMPRRRTRRERTRRCSVYSWTEIGPRLGITRQAAQQRGDSVDVRAVLVWEGLSCAAAGAYRRVRASQGRNDPAAAPASNPPARARNEWVVSARVKAEAASA